jgi:hypothetical protein
MSYSRSSHHLPATAAQPIRSGADALWLLDKVIGSPRRAETVAFLLDDAGFGGTIFVVGGTDEPDQVLDVAEHFASAGSSCGCVSGLVLATVRPAGGVEPGDIDRWFDASAIVEDNGLLLIEWFVFGDHGVASPRDLLGEAQRWPR